MYNATEIMKLYEYIICKRQQGKTMESILNELSREDLMCLISQLIFKFNEYQIQVKFLEQECEQKNLGKRR